jgi:hypothetical protein
MSSNDLGRVKTLSEGQRKRFSQAGVPGVSTPGLVSTDQALVAQYYGLKRGSEAGSQPLPYALRAAISGWMPRMFSTRVRL